jgi:hypothetical protein
MLPQRNIILNPHKGSSSRDSYLILAIAVVVIIIIVVKINKNISVLKTLKLQKKI